MAADLIVAPRPRPRLDPTPGGVVPGTRLIGFTLRGGFILLLAVMIARGGLPQGERSEAIDVTPVSLMRLALGAIVFAWLLWQGLASRERAPVYRTSLRIGLAGVPLAVICLIKLW